MTDKNIVNNIKNLGIFYTFVGLGSCFPEYVENDKYTTIAYIILLISAWFLLIKNIAIFYKDKELQIQNIIGSVLFALGFGMITFLGVESEMDINPTIAITSLVSTIAMLAGAVFLFIITYKLYKLTQIKTFLTYFILSFLSFVFIFLDKDMQIAYLIYYFILSTVFLIGIIKFYKQNS